MHLVVSMDYTVFDMEYKPSYFRTYHVSNYIYSFLPIQSCMGYDMMYLNFRDTSTYGNTKAGIRF